MESLSNTHRNPQAKNIFHFMDEETATEKKMTFPASAREFRM